MSKFTSYIRIGFIFAKGILGIRKKSYRLGFVKESKDQIWYIDMPWPGDRSNLSMVASSNKLLDYLCQEDGGYVTVDVLPRQNKENNPGYFECKQVESTLFGGAFYEVHGLDGFSREIWICPITLCVLGHYPKYIYIRKVETSNLK